MGQTIEPDEFHKSFIKPLTTKNNLVVFVQDRLSLQDLNEHADVYNPYSDGGAFKNIKSFMEDQFSVQLPSVISPWKAVEKMMKDFNGKVHKVMNAADLSKIDFGGQANLIIVSLNPVQGSSEEGKIFTENDRKMAEITKPLTKRGVKFTALYLGKTASKDSAVQVGVNRRLLAVDETPCTGSNCTFLNISCADRDPVLFYLRKPKTNVFVEIGPEENVTMAVESITDIGTTCDNDTVTLKLKFYALNVTSDSNVTFETEWNIVRDNITEYWNIDSNNINLTWKSETKNIHINASGESPQMSKNLSAPQDFSYHCSPYIIKYRLNETTNGTVNVTLILDGFQLQPFNVVNGKFSDGWDCVVFFTEGIWMAIISVLVMIIIVLFGLNMIASLKTMDRYDDPKGKTITVNVSE